MRSELTLGDIIGDNAVRYPDVPAYIAEGEILTHSHLLRRATELAAALAERGLRRQDRVAVLSRNSIRFGEVLAAGQLSGIVVATVNYRLSVPEMGSILRDAAPRVLFFESEYRTAVEEIRSELTGVDLYVCLDAAAPGAVEYRELLASGADRELPFSSVAADTACLIYTTGTTGRPKGCILGQRELRRMGAVVNGEMRSGSTDRALLVMPMLHIGAIAIALGVHARGGTAVLHRQFEPEAMLVSAAEDEITILHLAPTMLQTLVDAAGPDSPALAGIRTVVYSAAPVTSSILRAAMTAMSNAGFLNLYGQTEVITSGLPRELHRTATEDDRHRLTSVGHPFPETEVRIIDGDGRECPPGKPGEIVVRSPVMFRGYWNNDRATAETIRDGWCHTGDVGMFDAEGLLYLIDRKKDVIISGGENVYSVQVEEVVTSHPAVAEGAVIGIPDQRWGESVCAVVVLVEGAAVDADELREYVAARIARYKAPRRTIVVDELPKLPTGKLDKKVLRARYAGAETAFPL
ncbi:AMP-binding protein [Nocardia jiangxiensis]|uniref:AMP-binding protein n=1 Tax=Nocardia jiangxiensis TaxID=282685 RepID=A0ABW6SCL6_9NOCA